MKSVHPALAAFSAVPPARSGIFCDFDGTLSAIVADPSEAKAAPGAASALEMLAKRYSVVAIMSGRTVAQLAARITSPGVRLVGVHGLEERRGKAVFVAPEAESMRDAIARAADALEIAVRGMRGVSIERKGLSVVVHVRHANDPDEAQAQCTQLATDVARRESLVIIPGRRVIELRPPGGGDKGDALRRIALVLGLEAALVAGDDAGDLPAFETARQLPVSVCIGVITDESPPALRDAADICVEGPADVVRILRALGKRA